ncbi:O-antigen/teichoic acid export membrane protein [Haloarcula quadrata]|uniref:O-antigen/teichoic acid export membrane protein n=1 Tax=Haloarcula quadrata TaxID=182779 RepID=A0A495R252_9EURY|nr:transporter [Haloarcula quadrata]RKS81342.1 O-antigen/teichoic acid export membrane protein [Haloarcula quadrata]
MVEQRDGDEIDLLDSSIRTTSGALVSTTLFVLSGIVYAFVTSPAATGTYFFIALSVSLVLRPIRGISQALKKVGSERGELVGPYLGLAALFALGYLLIVGVIVAALAGVIVRNTVVSPGLLAPIGLFAVSVALSMIVSSLVGAIGYPSVETWLTSTQSAIQLIILLALAPTLATAVDLLLVVAGVRLAVLGPVAVALGVVPTLPDRHAVERAWDFAKWSIPDQIFDRLSYNMPVYVLGVVATPAAVGIYEAADRFADFGATISWHLSSPLLTKVSGDSSVGDTHLAYLDGAVTGGTGVTFVVFGYLLAAHDVVARIAFAGSETVFSATVLLVGGVNILRGFWTLTSHAIEGVGKPSVSFRTKLYGLVFSVPVPAILGAEFGAVAGAAGYAVMNLVIFGYVLYYSRSVFGRIPIEPMVATALTVGLGVSFVLTTGAVAGLSRAGLSPIVVASVAAVTCLVGFGGFLVAVSTSARLVAVRAATLWRSRARSLFG